MFVVGFILYERGFTIISMQTLFVTLALLLSFFPKLFFSLGFWLSASGVFYIFLFLIYFKEKSKLWQFLLLPIWVYGMMLPFSLFIFNNFSLYHPLSIIWTTLFILFYPLSLLLHAMTFGTLFDGSLLWLLEVAQQSSTIILHPIFLLIHILLSLISIVSKRVLYILLFMACGIFLYSLACTFFHLLP
jgi:competence protein ComEC